MDAVSIVLLLAYTSLGVELAVLAVPSEASSRQLLRAGGGSVTVDAITRARQRAAPEKIVRYAIPTALGIALFLVPLGVVIWPDLIEYLGALPRLQNGWLPWIGILLVVAGRAVAVTGTLQLRRRLQEQPHDLLSGGVFGRTRNPIVVGMHAFLLGTCCVFPCLVLVIGFVLFVLHMHRRVLMEESHLVRQSGERYREYCRRVPRYVLF